MGMSPTSHPQVLTSEQIERLSAGELGAQIKAREANGLTGATDVTLHALNVAQTNRMSNASITSTIAVRRAAGKPTAKLEAAARQRGISY